MKREYTWVVEVRGLCFKGTGKTLDEAKFNANALALKHYWHQ